MFAYFEQKLVQEEIRGERMAYPNLHMQTACWFDKAKNFGVEPRKHTKNMKHAKMYGASYIFLVLFVNNLFPQVRKIRKVIERRSFQKMYETPYIFACFGFFVCFRYSFVALILTEMR
jgi:uncharacterized membrane protein